MLPAINHVLEHEEQRYLIECEDLGADTSAFEVRISTAGNLLWNKRISYRDLTGDGAAGPAEAEVRGRMERTVQTARAAVLQGKVKG